MNVRHTYNLSFLLIFLSIPLFISAQELSLIENKGQWNEQAYFRAEVNGGYLYAEKDGLLFDFTSIKDQHQIASAHIGKGKFPKTIHSHAYKVHFNGASEDVTLRGRDRKKEYFNYFIGNDPEHWGKHALSYQSVYYENIYPNIDLDLYSEKSFVKYDIILHPGGDISQLSFQYDGVDHIKVKKGKLYISTSVNNIIEEKPYAYQWIDGIKKDVACQYQLTGNQLRYELGSYDPSVTLIIDPILRFSTYSGSNANNFGYTATYDRYGYLYSGSSVFGNGYPTTLGAYDVSFNGGNIDYAISKYDSTGTFMVYSTYIGGSGDELPHSIVVNDFDELYIFGTSSSANYPTTSNAYQSSFMGGSPVGLGGLGVNFANGTDIIVTRISSEGDDLLSSTFIGGTANDGLNLASNTTFNYADEIRGEIDLDADGNVYIASSTSSSNFPTTAGAFQTNIGNGQEGIVCKLSADLDQLLWSSFYGGSGDDAVYSLALDSEERVVICGGTTSSDLSVPASAMNTSNNGGTTDAFVVKFNADGSSLESGTYVGTSGYDQSYFVELDSEDNVHLFGQSTEGAQLIFNAAYNGGNSGQFISKLTPMMDSFIWSTTFGTGDGFPDISPTAFLVDLCSRIYLSGWGGPVQSSTSSTNGLPITADAYQSQTDGGDFYLFVIEEDASSLIYASFFGGDLSNEHVDGGTSRFDRKGKIYQSVCAGCQDNSDFPIFPSNAVSSTNNSGGCNNAVFKFDFDLPGILADFTFDPVCFPDPIQFNNISEGGLTFAWDFGDGSTSNDQNPDHQYIAPGVYDVTLIIADPMSCNLADTVSQQIIMLQEESFALPDETICNGESVQLGFDPIASPGYTYTWSPANLVTNANIANPYTNTAENTLYSLTVSNGVCESSSTQEVSIINVEAEFPEDIVSCEAGLDYTLSMGNYSTPATFIWSESPSLNPSINSDPNQDEIVVSPDGSNTYYIQMTHEGCEMESSVTVFIENFTIGLPDELTICDGQTTMISVTDPTPELAVTYLWEDNEAITSALTLPTISLLGTETTMLYVTGTSAHGCIESDSVLVTTETIALQMPADTIICDGTSIDLIANTSGLADTFSWSDDPSFTNILSTDTLLTVVPITSQTYYFQAQNACEIQGQVQVILASDNYSISPDIFLCQGDALTLSLTSALPQNYSVNWSPDNYIISGDGSASVQVLTTASQYFYADVTTEDGCIFQDSTLVEVSDLSTLSVIASADETVIPQGGSTVLHAEPATGYSIQWDPSEPLSSGTAPNPTATLYETTTFALSIQETHENGVCLRGDTITISVFEFACSAPTIFVPNAFSPNGDGHNDKLLVQSNYIDQMEFSIYDRWGELVFQTNNQDEGWDGYFQGVLASPDVYVYHLNLTCINKEKGLIKGNVTLLR